MTRYLHNELLLIQPICPATFIYKNYKGEIERRRVIPRGIFYGETIHHPATQWFLEADDLDRDVKRTFAMKNISEWEFESGRARDLVEHRQKRDPNVPSLLAEALDEIDRLESCLCDNCDMCDLRHEIEKNKGA